MGCSSLNPIPPVLEFFYGLEKVFGIWLVDDNELVSVPSRLALVFIRAVDLQWVFSVLFLFLSAKFHKNFLER